MYVSNFANNKQHFNLYYIFYEDRQNNQLNEEKRLMLFENVRKKIEIAENPP